MTWEEAFVAMSVALDATVDEAVATLDQPFATQSSEIVRGLRGDTRAGRAYTLATALAEISRELEQLEVAWPS